VEITTGKAIMPVGIAVNSVSDVIDIEARNIEDVSPVTKSISDNYVLGYAKTDNKIQVLLDTAQLFSQA
jgi:chemotaxis signal transduction protein